MGDGTKESPYTREDVIAFVKKNGGKAEGLDLSRKVFEKAINLSGLNLDRISFREAIIEEAHLEKTRLWGAKLESANLQYAHLENAEMPEAHLEKANLVGARLEKAEFVGAYLQGADFSISHLQGAVFSNAYMEGVFLWGAHFSQDTDFEHVNWGNCVLGDEKEGQTKEEKEEYYYIWATDNPYRRLKIWYTNAGRYDIAGQFFFREMTVRRKIEKWWPNPLNRAFSKLLSILCGYGEKPERVFVSALVIVFGLTIAYRFGGLDLPYSIYYSAVSFTAVGYGNWVPEPIGWAKGLGVAEAVLGVFMMALFLVTFTRKMTR